MLPRSRVHCPHCGTAGTALHESLPRFLRVAPPAKAPKVLWIIILRSKHDSLSRHRVKLPGRLYFDAATGEPRGLPEGAPVPPRVLTYALNAVMLYHSKKERHDPPPEFDGDSGGRYSICVHLGEADGFYWFHEDANSGATPVRGDLGTRLIECHGHTAFYNAVLPPTEDGG